MKQLICIKKQIDDSHYLTAKPENRVRYFSHPTSTRTQQKQYTHRDD